VKTKTVLKTERSRISQTVSRTPLPARTVSSATTTGAQEVKLTSILVPTDFSEASTKALVYAAAFARQFGAKITLLHVVEPIATPDFDSSFPLALEDAAVDAHCKRRLETLATEHGFDPAVVEKILVRHGRAFHEIATAAKSMSIDLIIISTHGYTGLKHTFMGSTAERVVRHAGCPVLVVRPEEHEFVAS
jgi:universal stress protein A